ncbi:MAG: hypothetical protein J6P45_03845 [Lachnospiraceae bacterium]|nr:hypothetical protein [Lachnospiraceae bacterium]
MKLLNIFTEFRNRIKIFIVITISGKKHYLSLFRVSVVLMVLLMCWFALWLGKELVNDACVSREIRHTREVIREQRYVMHACGAVSAGGISSREYVYTNSKEAMKTMYENGHRVAEIDFLFSSDGYLLCSHEWENLYLNDVLIRDYPVTKEDFLKLKRYNEFSTMWLGDVADFMRENEDLYVITDIFGGNEEGCRQIAEFCPDLMDRFIIQIYHESEYEGIAQLGFKNIIFTLFGTNEDERSPDKLIKAAKDHRLVGYTFWYYWADDPLFLSTMKKTKIPLYVHTVTDRNLEKKYFDMGITAIYTDNNKENHF